MGCIRRPFAFCFALVFGLLIGTTNAGAAESATSSPKKIARWESDLSIGGVTGGRLAIVKSFWWSPLPKIVAIGLSFDYITQFLPLSIDVSVSAPIPVIVPFVCAGAGAGLSGGGVTSYGGGLKIRLGRRIGIIAEYRNYRYRPRSQSVDLPLGDPVHVHYFGAGLAWIY
jgi:hypothetical protein